MQLIIVSAAFILLCFLCLDMLSAAKDRISIYKSWIVSVNQNNVSNKFNGEHTLQSTNYKNDYLLHFTSKL